MKMQNTIPFNKHYKREGDFSQELSENISLLNIGNFDESETEAHVGTRSADIVVKGANGTLVIENQFGKADWDHWGRLEAYARLKNANVAALIAEDFVELHNNNKFDEIVSNKILPIREILASNKQNVYNHPQRLPGFERHMANMRRRRRRF